MRIGTEGRVLRTQSDACFASDALYFMTRDLIESIGAMMITLRTMSNALLFF